MQFNFKCETLRVLSEQLRYYNKKTDRFKLTNHSRPCKQLKYYNRRITRVFIVFVFTELEPKYKNIRSCNHQSINQFIYGPIKLKKRERRESENFDGKLHLKKQIKIQLIQRHEHEHKHGFISRATTSINVSGTELSDSTLTPIFPHHQNPGG